MASGEAEKAITMRKRCISFQTFPESMVERRRIMHQQQEYRRLRDMRRAAEVSILSGALSTKATGVVIHHRGQGGKPVRTRRMGGTGKAPALAEDRGISTACLRHETQAAMRHKNARHHPTKKYRASRVCAIESEQTIVSKQSYGNDRRERLTLPQRTNFDHRGWYGETG